MSVAIQLNNQQGEAGEKQNNRMHAGIGSDYNGGSLRANIRHEKIREWTESSNRAWLRAGPSDSVSYPPALDFGVTGLNQPVSRMVTVVASSGPGSSPVSLGETPAGVTVSSACPSQLPAGQQCTVTVEYSAGSAGTLAGSVSIGGQSISLAGTTESRGVLTLDLGTFADFGQVTLAGSGQKQLILTNTGTGPVQDITVTKQGTAQFSISDNSCTSQAIAIGQSCTVTLAFMPTGAGTQTATYIVGYSDTLQAQTKELVVQGNGRDSLLASVVWQSHFDTANFATSEPVDSPASASVQGSGLSLDTASYKFGGGALRVPPGSGLSFANTNGLFSMRSKSWTIDFWIQVATNEWVQMVGQGGQLNDWAIYRYPDGRVCVGKYGVNEACSATNALPPGGWHHVSFSKGPNGLRLYVDGGAVREIGSPYDFMAELGKDLSIGLGSSTEIKIDDLRITMNEQRCPGYTCPVPGNPF